MVHHIIGIMSGSSLDGLDIAWCSFQRENRRWTYRIEQADTISYDNNLAEKLGKLYDMPAEAFVQTDIELGRFIGQSINRFIDKHRPERIDYIASHGHTAFHNPSKGYSTQIGSGAIIAAIANLPSITDFRSLDVALGGQGAPLVPIGDEHLFSGYDYCLNLGGYGNISYHQDGKRLAFDICPVNKAINSLARQAGEEMDKDGAMASQGFVNESLLTDLNRLGFYRASPPKSLGDDWFNHQFKVILEDSSQIPLKDQLRTIYEHIAIQINEASKRTSGGAILTTGGGAHNRFLMDCIQKANNNRIVVPDKKLIEFKEAMIFAFMGLLRSENQINCLSSVTGASRDSSGGIICYI